MKNKELKKRIMEISKKLGLTHVGSCLCTLPILIKIYKKKKSDDIIILDNAHAHLAHLVVMEAFIKMGDIMPEFNAEALIKKDVHCNRKSGCVVSGGSLMHGIGIAIGLCVANPEKTIFLIISDGGAMEPELGAGLRIAKQLKLNNLKIHTAFNGFTATRKIDIGYLEQWISGYNFPVLFHKVTNGLPELDGVQGHYVLL